MSSGGAIIITPSDGAYGAMPGGASQQGLMVGIAEPSMLHGIGRVNLLEWSSTKIKRVVRSSMAAEVSAATSAFEHGDFVRVALAEMLQPDFELRMWRKCAAMWRQFSVIDAKCAYDSVNSALLPSDKRVAIDVAVLREALLEPEANSFMKWVPGPQMVSDSLTKLHGNDVLDAIMRDGTWSLVENEERRKESKVRCKARRLAETQDLPKEGEG